MLASFKNNLKEATTTILPIVVFVITLCLIVPMPPKLLISFLLSSLLLILGTGLFTFGAELSMVVIGERIGNKLVKSKKILMILLISFIIGTVVTIAEPDLRVLADQLTNIPSNTLIIIISVGLGIFMLLAAARSLFGLSLNWIQLISFIIIFILIPFVPEDFIPVAFDSGGVTTGTISIPFIMTMGIGLVANRTDKNAKDFSFGLVGLCSTGPILMVMLMGLFYPTNTTMDTGMFLNNSWGFIDYIHQVSISLGDVLFSITPIVLVFIIFQLFTKDINKIELRKIIFGILIVIIGLTLFLTAANVGFMDMGYFIGESLTSSNHKYLLVPISMIIAFFVAIAEPAVAILIDQVEELTEGSISKSSMKFGLSIGVSLAAGLSIIRAFTGTSILYYILPCYILCLILMFVVPKTFTAIAFDSGGAAGGTLTTAFLLPIAIGICLSTGGNILTDAFGLAAMASVVPIITVQLIGLIYEVKQRIITRIEELDDSIIDYNWEGSNG